MAATITTALAAIVTVAVDVSITVIAYQFILLAINYISLLRWAIHWSIY